ncbi:F0F1 ATP synthase subunit gamma [Marinobacter salinus]|uniref:F0F1 ATP synthase subunit gamma n=1 Tax=Marinobacter salinus TaxID=1874317 RepID=A0A1D9GKN8_9GAMM|nr:F0F1 ATP synthase subunit gamma [Marinobacter salinus]AOY88084.1 F0F1 ATP synthase subunit gamma [Marinobacter salinus]
MESLEQLHKQLDSLDQLRSIVKTMKALSAANIHQFEQAVEALGGYYRTVELGLHVVLKDMKPSGFEHGPASRPRRLGAVVFGSDHGLCGRFNEEIAEHAIMRMDSTAAEKEDRRLLAVGARVAGSLENAGLHVEEDFLTPGSAVQITATVQQILLKIDQWQEEAGAHYIFLFYNRHSRQRSYQPTGVQLLPMNLRRFHRLEEEPWPSRSLPTFTMERQALFHRLLDQYLFVSVFRACAESQASEHASRLSAMQSAERNLDERIGDVTMSYRRARQTVITSELLDLVSGFEALEPKNPKS